MTITPTEIPDVLILSPKKHGDARGFFSEVYKESVLAEHGFTEAFIQDNHAYSAEAGVLRGLHYQSPPFAQDKLVRVVRGSIYDVAVDIRKGSATFGKWVGVELSADNWQQLLVPKGFAHGYLTLEPDTEVLYKVTNRYAPECDKGVLWNDAEIGVDWPLKGEPILSAKDEVQPLLSEIELEFTL
ncbi:dTDP-4-dehydrorhamnose 3,5-epimerase [Rubritalea tangerina]|uniref:dTDP-4-dehydrorhamnose 3,5-epimerase n=1 Tax=Rubritalea tangerina TaxID=430798 RepID=A0ABW4ZC31_9BACT